jgi:hypothetical protein
MGSMFLVAASADADTKLDKPLDATVRNVGRLPAYFVEAALTKVVFGEAAPTEATKKFWNDKKYTQQLFLFGHGLSGRTELWTLDKRELLKDLEARREFMHNPISKLENALGARWESEGFFKLLPEFAEGDDMDLENHTYTHLGYQMLDVKVTPLQSCNTMGFMTHGPPKAPGTTLRPWPGTTQGTHGAPHMAHTHTTHTHTHTRATTRHTHTHPLAPSLAEHPRPPALCPPVRLIAVRSKNIPVGILWFQAWARASLNMYRHVSSKTQVCGGSSV